MRSIPLSVLSALALIAAMELPLRSAPVSAAQPPYEGYLDHAALTSQLQQLAAEHPQCAMSRIGESRQGRPIHLLTLARDPASAANRPALLIAAGLDGRHLVGTETALRIARRLLDEHPDQLEAATVYIIPRGNPDAAEVNLSETVTGQGGTFRPIDEDHDGELDEDPPVDLNGDGFITIMRRANPPLDERATHVADPAEPRLLKAPDPAMGEAAVYAVYPEGLDDDGDGRIAEDGAGAVDLDRNFMRGWPEHSKDAGPYQLSEPESEALATFVLEHPQIVAAIVFGRHDNVVKVPDGKGSDITERAPKSLHEDDVAYHKEVAKTYRELTGQKRAASSDDAGSFHAWLYAHRGIPTFASSVWARPDEATSEEGEAAGAESAEVSEEADADEREAGEEEGSQSAEAEAAGEAPASTEHAAERAEAVDEDQPPDESETSSEGDEGDGDEGDEGNEDDESDGEEEKAGKPSDEEAAAWLAYSDDARSGAGYVEWQPFDHPTLGPVEIGGFVAGFRMNPPADELDEIAEKQTAFAMEVLQRHPRLSYEGPVVKRLADGLYEVRFGIVNEGYLPTTTAMARQARTVIPTVIRLSTPEEQVVAGERVVKIRGIEGSGERSAHHWIIRGEPGSAMKLEILNRQLGDRTFEFDLDDSAP